jgi:hypothetical protein
MPRDDDETPPGEEPDNRTAAPNVRTVAPAGGSGRARGVTIDGARVAVAEPVRCADCDRFRPSRVPLLGRCAAGQPESPAGLWAQDVRACPLFLAADLADAIRAMAARWQYLPDELAWALEHATKMPAEWWALIEADLRKRLWPGAEGEVEAEAAQRRVNEPTE